MTKRRTLQEQAPEIAEMIADVSPIKATEVTPQSNKKALFVCAIGHSWEARIASVYNGSRCPYCAGLKVLPGFNDLATMRPELLSMFDPTNLRPPEYTLGAGSKNIQWSCSICNGVWSSQARNIRTAESACPYCNRRLVLPGYNDFATICPRGAKLWSPRNFCSASEVLPYSNTVRLFVCDKHGEWKAPPNRITSGSGCKKCTQVRSKGEIELADWLTTFGTLEISVRNIASGFEADCYIPEKNIAIEFNGVYWHSDKVMLQCREMTAYEYHKRKKQAFKDVGVMLLFVWEDDWMNQHEAVETALSHVFAGGEPDSVLTTLSKG